MNIKTTQIPNELQKKRKSTISNLSKSDPNEDGKKTTEILVSTTKPVTGVVFNISTRLWIIGSLSLKDKRVINTSQNILEETVRTHIYNKFFCNMKRLRPYIK